MNSIKIIQISAVIATFFMWGISEGIVMIQSSDKNYRKGWIEKWNTGARAHIWFRWYHLIDSLVFIGVGTIGWLLAMYFQSYLFLIGLGFIGWQAKETGYSFSRWRRLIDKTEHINFFDMISFELSPLYSIIFSLSRVVLGITFILIGGTK